jgi:uncharacterized protein (DUF169 family)
VYKTSLDFSSLDKLNLERKPVGVKFLAFKPEGIERTQKRLALCEMFIEAYQSKPFYAQEEDFPCIEPLLLGMKELEPVIISGSVSKNGGMFKESRANRKVFQYIPRMLPGSVNYVAFSSVDQLTFDPDVLIITANVIQARTILRSEGYSSGDPWSAKGTPILACSWLYIYPFMNGKINYTVTGLSMGMDAINAPIPEGLFIISIPWNLLPTVLENLKDDNLHHSYRAANREEHFKGFHMHLDELRKQLPNYHDESA